MAIEERTVFVSPDGQFHETREKAEEYVARGDIEQALRGSIASYLENSDNEFDNKEAYEDSCAIARIVMEKFNITKKEG